MKADNDKQSSIVAIVVPEDERLDFLPRYFGKHMMLVETQIYHQFRNLCPHYTGGYWDFYELSNGGCYLAPNGAHYRILHPGNYVNASASGDAAGIMATLYMLSHLSFTFAEDPFGDQLSTLYHLLRDYASDHPEASLIYRVID